MIDPAVIPTVQAAVEANEGAGDAWHILSYARQAKSGASFGRMQGDLHADPDEAGAVLAQILTAAGIAGDDVDRLAQAFSVAFPTGCPPALTADEATINAALSSPAGQAAIIAMDDVLFQRIVDSLNAAIATSPFPIETEALCYAACWFNMTGPPTNPGMLPWLAARPGPTVTSAEMQEYLQATAYFSTRPRNFAHLQASVATGMAAPAATS
jgi:hypothetical protein